MTDGNLTCELPTGIRGSQSLVEALSEAMDPAAVFRRIVEQALLLIPGAEGAVVELVSESTLVYVCASGSLSQHVGLRMPMEGSLAGVAVATGEILRCDDSRSDPRVNSGAAQKVAAISMLCVPLMHGAGPVGVLKVTSPRASAFTDRDVEVLGRLAEFIATTVDSASEFSRLIGRVLGSSETATDPSSVLADDDEIARFVANVVKPNLIPDATTRRRIESVLATSAFEMVYQPIIDLRSGELVAAEALARFMPLPYRPPDTWFAEAYSVALGIELELAAVRAALADLPALPSGARLSVNVGPLTIGSPGLAAMVEKAGSDRVILELTEHVRVEDYPELNARISGLRASQVLLAIDDTGGGISSLSHVLKMAPEVIKLDREITSGVDVDPIRRALTSSLVAFAAESGAEVIAEGIESGEELRMLQDLGVIYGQGFFIGRPGPAETLAERRRFGGRPS